MPRPTRRANSEKMVVATYAKRFAAKEACSKALGTGIRRGVWWRDMGVVNLPGGRPTMLLTGGALARLQPLTPDGLEARIDLSHHRRLAAGAGFRHNFGGRARQSLKRGGGARVEIGQNKKSMIYQWIAKFSYDA